MKLNIEDDRRLTFLIFISLVTAIGSSGIQADSTRHLTSKRSNLSNANYHSTEIPRIILQTSKFIQKMTSNTHITLCY